LSFDSPNDLKDPNRLKFLQIAVGAGLLAGILFSHELWFPLARTFPRAPLIFGAPVIVEQILSVLLIIALIFTAIFVRAKIFLIVSVLSLALLIFFDQTRLQPWVYQYLLLLLIFALCDRQTGSDQPLGLTQLIIAALYFWSGAQKMNFTFSHETIPALLAPFSDHFSAIRSPFVFFAITIALLETAIAFGLLFRKTRNAAVLTAALMHTIILGFLVAKDFNNIVWIWNLTLIFIVFIAFWQSKVSVRRAIFEDAGDWKLKTAKAIVAASVLLPALSFAGWWDMYLSGALYSGNTEVAVVRINDEVFEKLPPNAREAVFQTESGAEKMLPLFEWAIDDLNVPPYPERRVSRKTALAICDLAHDKNQIELMIKERPAILDGSYKVSRISCEELEKR
jgi:hypothetical protein